MKIIITTDSYYPQVNGASIFGQRLAVGLKERGHSVLVIAPGTSLRSGYCTVAGVSMFGVGSAPVFFYSGMRVAIPGELHRVTGRVMDEFRPDVVHAQGHFTVSKAVIDNARRAGVPVIGTNHFMPENLTHYAHVPKKFDERLQRWMWSQFREVYGDIAAVTTPTARAAGYMRTRGFGSEIKVVSNGIDLKRFRPDQDTTTLRSKYHLPTTPLLLYVGRLDKEKNLDLVLKALSMVSADVTLHFAVAGNGASRQSLEKLSAGLGVRERVTFLGFVPDMDLPALYSAAQCFVMAGTAELQSIATMEAMASGLPVVAADAVALPELVQTERNGFLFEPGNAAMLSELLTRVFTDPALRDRMGRESLDIIQAHAVERTMGTFEAAYQAVIQDGARRSPAVTRRRAKRLTASVSN